MYILMYLVGFSYLANVQRHKDAKTARTLPNGNSNEIEKENKLKKNRLSEFNSDILCTL